MRALLSETAGPPETLRLRDIPAPVPGEGEMLIRVHACGINYPDILLIEDRYQFTAERPFAPGMEIAGEVEAVGPGVPAKFKPGTRVVAQVSHGGLAEKAVAPCANAHILPDGLSYDDAAAMLLTYATSYHALRDRAKLQAGETLLVLGAAGGVGLAAVELGKAMGARVVAAVSSQDKADIALSHGADSALLYPAQVQDPRALCALFKSACPDGADVIYDPVGGPYAEPALRSIAWEGRYLVVGFPAGIPSFAGNLALLKGCQIMGVFWGAAMQRAPDHASALIAELFALRKEGKLAPFISQRFTLADGGAALAALRDRRATGKLVVNP